MKCVKTKWLSARMSNLGRTLCSPRVPIGRFTHAKIEQYGTGNNRRSDLRIFCKGSQTPVLAGEVKLPERPKAAVLTTRH